MSWVSVGCPPSDFREGLKYIIANIVPVRLILPWNSTWQFPFLLDNLSPLQIFIPYSNITFSPSHIADSIKSCSLNHWCRRYSRLSKVSFFSQSVSYDEPLPAIDSARNSISLQADVDQKAEESEEHFWAFSRTYQVLSKLALKCYLGWFRNLLFITLFNSMQQVYMNDMEKFCNLFWSRQLLSLFLIIRVILRHSIVEDY